MGIMILGLELGLGEKTEHQLWAYSVIKGLLYSGHLQSLVRKGRMVSLERLPCAWCDALKPCSPPPEVSAGLRGHRMNESVL